MNYDISFFIRLIGGIIVVSFLFLRLLPAMKNPVEFFQNKTWQEKALFLLTAIAFAFITYSLFELIYRVILDLKK